MTPPTKQRLRQTWFSVHKWIGLILAVLIIPISLTGSALVWHDALDEWLNPERATSARVALPVAAYAAAAKSHSAAGETLVSVRLPEERGPVVATLGGPPPKGGGRPVRTMLYLDPADARLLDRSASDEGAVRVLHVLHGSLMVPGVGRQIVGWVGVAMLLSSLTGLWLWWPIKGSVRRGLRWKRMPSTSGNLHHQGGFWIAIPLAALSFTGAWISFPAFFAQLSGDPAGPSSAERMRRMAAAPLVETRLAPDQAVALAQPHAPAGPLAIVTWPTDKSPEWKVSFAREGGPAEIVIDDRSGEVTPPKPPRPETTARLMRRIHDGTGMGLGWQIVIFVGGIIPALLAITGIIMWWKGQRREAAMKVRRKTVRQPLPAE